MKANIHYLVFLFLLVQSCHKDTSEPLLRCDCVNESDAPPVASFNIIPHNSCMGGLYPGGQVTLVSTATDYGENNIKEYIWIVNGVTYSGAGQKQLTVKLDNAGTYNVEHIVKDRVNTSKPATGEVKVMDFPSQIKVRLTGVYTTSNVGDGTNSLGNVFFVVNSIRETEDGSLEVANQNIYPNNAPTSYTFGLPPNSYIDFLHRGVILYEGNFADRWGASFVALEYDPAQSCTVCDILGSALPAVGLIVEPFVPGASAVGEAAGAISNLVGDYVSADANTTVLSHIEIEHGPEDQCIYGYKQVAYFGGLKIEYIVETIP
jgi:hypothetical protein